MFACDRQNLLTADHLGHLLLSIILVTLLAYLRQDARLRRFAKRCKEIRVW